MPLFCQYNDDPQVQVNVWHILEDETYFYQRLPLHPDDAASLAKVNPMRRIESLACRYALHDLLQPSGKKDYFFQKDNCQKPFLPHHPHLHCSISHTRHFAAAILSACNCGIDIQAYSPKMPKLVPRFLHPIELQDIENSTATEEDRMDMYHFMWSVKESLYKIWGKLELDFRQEMSVTDMILPNDLNPGSCKGFISHSDQLIYCTLQLHKLSLNDKTYYLSFGTTND